MIAPLIFAREWTVCHAVEGFFVTCDHPVFRWIPHDAWHAACGDGGFKNIKAEITFPLAPDRLLMIAGTELLEPAHYFDGQAVLAANRMRALAAERYLYSPRKDDGIKALAIAHRDDHHQLAVGSGDRAEVKIVRKLRDRG